MYTNKDPQWACMPGTLVQVGADGAQESVPGLA